MPITNRDVKRASRQLFASSRAIVTPFYNRVASRQEISELFADPAVLRGSTVIVSAPMGTGKTFFIDQIARHIGVVGRATPLIVKEVSERDLARERGKVVFIDEGDIKSDWSSLVRGIETIGAHVKESGVPSLVLGDYVLRNPKLVEKLPEPRFLRSFEPLDREFLQGVVRQRLQHYLGASRSQDVIVPDLYDVLAPDGMAQVNSFRTILSFLEGLVGTLPFNGDTCRLTVEMATQFVSDNFNPSLSTERQGEFLNRFLDLLADSHPRGEGLDQGLSKEQMFELARAAGYTTWGSFQEEVIDRFGDLGLLVSRGIPGPDDKGAFARWVEPYYPSLLLMLLAEA